MNTTLLRHPIAQLTLAVALTAAVASAAQAQVAARDSASSPLRAPTAAEAQSAAANTAQPVGMLTGRVNPQPVRYKDGTIGQELDASTMMYSVARRNADGSVSQYCVEGPEAAQKVVNGKVVTETKGHPHELK